MKLTTAQIDQLYAFTIKHYVEYYDLQTELVDHLANAIEQQWQENPKLSFEEALQIEFKKFGVMGFTTLVDKRKLVLQKKYNKIANGYLKEFFKLPAIIFTMVFFCITAFYLSQDERVFITGILMMVFVSFIIYNWIVRLIERYRVGWEKSKKWLFEEVLRKHDPLTFFGFFIFTSYYVPDLKEKLHFSIPFLIQSTIDSAFIVYFVLYIYIMKIVIPSKAEQYLKETYPEYEISK